MSGLGNALRERDPLDLATAQQMLQYVDAHDRETWVQVGKALAAEFGPAAEEVYRAWSEQAGNFTEQGFRSTWRHCLRKPGRYSAGTVVALALKAGYRFERREMTDEQRARLAQLRREAEGRRAQAERQREQGAVSAQAQARMQWREAAREGVSLYAQRKGIDRPEACRYAADGALLVPMVRPDLPAEQALRGLQRIYPDGAKRFTAGMEKAGTCCRLGLVELGQPLLLCEGWATGGSLRMALASMGRALPVLVAFDAGNLLEVSRVVAGLYPDCVQLICADDDWQTFDKQGRPMNPGRVAAQQARDERLAEGRRALMCHPVWRRARSVDWTDFNDLHASEGLAAVSTQLGLALQVTNDLWKGGRRG